MRISRLVTGVLLLAMLFAGCSSPAIMQYKLMPMQWTGAHLEGEGFTFYERRMPFVTVHYAPPTAPDEAEQAATMAQSFLEHLRKDGRCCPSERIHVWLIPANATWPAGVPENPSILTRAVGPGQIVSRPVKTPSIPGGGIIPPGLGPLDAALTVAVTQDTGSPAFTVDWLHQGMGTALSEPWDEFPSWTMRVASSAQAAARWLETKTPGVDITRPAMGLASLVIDRWGYDWPSHYPRTAEELTPEAMLLWATGAPDRAAALKLWDERQKFVPYAFMVSSRGRKWTGTARTISPERMAPKLGALPKGPGPMANYSPHRYAIKARYEPANATVTGELTLTWQNGEGIPIDTLYFNLWPNSESFAAGGGRMRIQSARVDGKPTAFSAQGLDLSVALGRTVAHGEQSVVTISFSTRLSSRADAALGQSGAEHFALGLWYPMLAVLDDRGWNLTPFSGSSVYTEHADYAVELDVPAGTTLAATGKPASRMEADGRWVYRSDAPRVLTWAATGGQGLEEVAQQVGGVRLRVMGKDREWRDRVAAEAAHVIPFLEQRYGAGPSTEMTIVQGPAMSVPGVMGMVGEVDQSEYWKNRIASLLAEQWFPNATGCDAWGEPWLCMAFGDYAYRGVIREFRPSTPFPRPITSRAPAGLQLTSPRHDFDRWSGYRLLNDGGPLVLVDLEEVVGRPAMEQLLKEWLARYRGKTITITDFMTVAEQVTGRDLKKFFSDQLIDPSQRGPYRPALPLGKMALP